MLPINGTMSRSVRPQKYSVLNTAFWAHVVQVNLSSVMWVVLSHVQSLALQER